MSSCILGCGGMQKDGWNYVLCSKWKTHKPTDQGYLEWRSSASCEDITISGYWKTTFWFQSQRFQPKFLRSDFCDVNLHSGMWRNAERGFWNYVFWMDMSSVAEDQTGGNCGDFLVKSNPPLLTWSPSFGCLLPSPGLNTAFIKPPGPISLFFLQSINRLRKGKLSKARNSEPRRRIEGGNKSIAQNNAAHTWGFPWHQTFCLRRGSIRPLPSLPRVTAKGRKKQNQPLQHAPLSNY